MMRTPTFLGLLMLLLTVGGCSAGYVLRTRMTGLSGATPASREVPSAAALPNPEDLDPQLGAINRAVYGPQLVSFRAVVESLAAVLEVHRLSPANLGQTLAWNQESYAYAPAIRSPAPAGAIRVILYEIDAATDRPAVPLVEIGAIDLYPRNRTIGGPASTTTMRYVVSGVGTDPPVYADFKVVKSDPHCACARITGWITDAVTHVDFSAPYSIAADSGVRFTAIARVASSPLELHFAATLEESLIHSDVRFKFQGDSLMARGLIMDGDDSAVEGAFTVFVNGRSFSEGNGDNTTIVGPHLRALTAVEVMANRQLYALTYGLLMNIAIPAYLTFNCGC
jgi:hypothetical protein